MYKVLYVYAHVFLKSVVKFKQLTGQT